MEAFSFMWLLSDNFDSLFFAKLEAQVFQLELLNFSASCHREFFDEEYIFGNLVAGDFSLAELADVKFVHRISFVENDERSYRFTVFL